MLKNCLPARVGMDRAGIGISSRDPTAMHRLSRVCRVPHRPRNDMIAVARMHGGIPIAVKNDGRDGLSISDRRRNVAGLQSIRQVTLRMATNADGRSLAAPQARPECTPIAAYRSG